MLFRPCRTGEECFDTTGNVRDRLMCARADISPESIEESRANCESAGACHYNTGWQWTDGSNMNLPWIETLRPGNIQDCGCHVSEGGWVPDRAVAGSPQKPFDNYGQNENEMAYCGEACCAVPGRENWGAVSAATVPCRLARL